MSQSDSRRRTPGSGSTSPPAAGVRRREALQALAGGVGVGLILPSVVHAEHPMRMYLASPSTIARARQQAAAGTGTTAFLDTHQVQTLESLAETIVPGSTEAGVAPFLDRLLAVDASGDQQAFVTALGAFDMAATDRFGHPWIAATGDEQVAGSTRPRPPIRTARRFGTTSSTSRTGSSGPTTRRSPACGNSGGTTS